MKAEFEPVHLTPADYDKWDSFVDASPQGDVFCYSWWLNAVTKGNFKLLALLDRDEIVAGIPLAYYSGRINEPPLTRTLGPLFRNAGNMSEYDRITLQRRCLNLLIGVIPFGEVEQFCTSHNFNDWLSFKWQRYMQMTRYTYIIDYSGKDDAALWSCLSREKKRSIGRACKNGISTSITSELLPFYRLVELTYKRQGLEFPFPFDDFKMLDDEIVKRDRRRIITAFDDNSRLHAAIYITFSHKSAYALLSAGDPQFRHLGGHTLVMWEAIRHFRDKVGYFNFGGSDIERIERHIRGFGGVQKQYFRIFTENSAICRTWGTGETVGGATASPTSQPDHWRYHVGRILHHSLALLKKLARRARRILPPKASC
jgi:hypothetical protein